MTKTFDRIIEWGIIFLIVFTPLAFGSVYAWAYSIMELTVIFLIAVWLLKILFTTRGSASEAPVFVKTPFIFPVLLLLLSVVFQMTPLPRSVIQALSPNMDRLYQFVAASNNSSWMALSPYSHATKIGFLKILAYAGIFFLIIYNIRTPDQVRNIVLAILITGLLISVLAILQMATGTTKVYWFWQPLDKPGGILPNNAHGPYVNRNHFGGYMEMAIPLFLGFLMPQLSRYYYPFSQRETWRRWFTRFSSILSKNIFLLLTLIVMVYTLLYSFSRGGITSFLLAMVFFTNVLIFSNRQRKGYTIFLVSLILVSFVFLVWLGIGPVVDRMSTLADPGHEPNFVGRARAFRDTLTMIINYPLFGVGLGNFSLLFPQYQSPEGAYEFFDHTHNDYLEYLSELGVVGLGLFIWIGVIFARMVIRRLKGFTIGRSGNSENAHRDHGRPHEHSPHRLKYKRISLRHVADVNALSSGIFLGCVTGMIAILLHSFTDFNLQIPANALLFTILGALAVSLTKIND